MKEACGVVGVFSPGQQASRAAFFGIHALQHRGQESAGIAASSGTNIQVKTQMGLVTQVFQEKDLSDLDGYIALGHTRYSTTGSSHIDNAQPFLSKSDSVEIALGHNGNLINALELRNELLDLGVNFQSSADSEIIAHLISHAPASSLAERISYAMRKLNGAYSLGIMTNEEIIGVRDPLGLSLIHI